MLLFMFSKTVLNNNFKNQGPEDLKFCSKTQIQNNSFTNFFTKNNQAHLKNVKMFSENRFHFQIHCQKHLHAWFMCRVIKYIYMNLYLNMHI